MYRKAGNSEDIWKPKPSIQGSKTVDADFQMTSVLLAIFKQCTHCTTDKTDASWKLKSRVRSSVTADLDFQMTSVLPAIFKRCTDCTNGNTDASWKLTSQLQDNRVWFPADLSVGGNTV